MSRGVDQCQQLVLTISSGSSSTDVERTTTVVKEQMTLGIVTWSLESFRAVEHGYYIPLTTTAYIVVYHKDHTMYNYPLPALDGVPVQCHASAATVRMWSRHTIGNQARQSRSPRANELSLGRLIRLTPTKSHRGQAPFGCVLPRSGKSPRLILAMSVEKPRPVLWGSSSTTGWGMGGCMPAAKKKELEERGP